MGKLFKRLMFRCLGDKDLSGILAEEAESKRQVDGRSAVKREETGFGELVAGYASLAKVRRRNNQRWPGDPELEREGWRCCFKYHMEIKRGRWF